MGLCITCWELSACLTPTRYLKRKDLQMLYNEMDINDYEVAVETALLEDEQLMDEIMSEMEEVRSDCK